MNKPTFLSCCSGFLCMLMLVVSCRAAADTTTVVDAPVDRLLRTLSLEEKAGQTVLAYFTPGKFLLEHRVGGVLVMQNMVKNGKKFRRQLDRLQKKLPVPLLVTIDQEGGSVNRLSSVKGWEKTPSAQEIGEWEPDSIRVYTRQTASVLKRFGINMNLAPVLDPAVNTAANRNTYMGTKMRSFGNGTERIVTAARAFIDGFTREGIFCVAKHFPGYDVESNSDHEPASSDTDSVTVAGHVAVFNAMNPFTVGTMMTSIYYHTFCDTPAVLSGSMVSWARSIAGDNIIMTDDLWGTALRAYMLPGTAIHPTRYPDSSFALLVESAVRAGNDMLMITYPAKVPLMIRTIVRLAERDETVRKHIDNAVRRILLIKEKLGLLAPH